jgi:HlyD family secretion protein
MDWQRTNFIWDFCPMRRIFLVGFLSLLACQTTKDSSWQLYTVKTGSLDLGLQESGEIVSLSEITLRVPYDGKLTQLLPEGSIIKAGQEIGRMDTSAQITERDNAQISLTDAQMDKKLAQLDKEIRKATGVFTQSQVKLQARIESLKLQQLEQERDQANLTRIREGLKSLAQKLEILELEARERTRLFELGYLSRQERDQARLQRDEALKEKERLEAELIIAEKGPRIQDIRKQKLAVDKAKLEVKQAQREAAVQVKVADVMQRSAESRIKSYQQRLNYYQGLIQKGVIRATVPGTLVYGKLQVGQEQVPVKAGDSVKEGVALVRLVDLQQPVVRLTLHEIDAPQIHLGQTAQIQLEAWPELKLKGKVQRLLPIARKTLSNDQLEIQGVTCEIRLEKSDPHLRPGMTAQVNIRFEELKNVLIIPSQALIQNGKEAYCWTLEKGQAVRHSLTLGPSDARNTVVQQGLQAGDQVILNPIALETQRQEASTNASQ